MIGGESFFLNHFTAGSSGGDLYLATSMPGDMQDIKLEGTNLIVQAGSFVAAEKSVEVDVGWQGFKNFLSGCDW